MSESVAIFIDRAKFYISDFTSSLLSVICQPSSALKINGRTFNVIKLLGEGGFSFVYLAEDTDSGRTFALKKIRAPTAETVKIAMSEIEAYRRFRSENIIRILDSAVLQDESGEGKIIWVFLPFYERGNLQDLITRSSLSTPPTYPPEAQLLQLFLGTCQAVKAMHQYRPNSKPSPSAAYPPAGGASSATVGDGEEEEGGMLLASRGGAAAPGESIFDEGEENRAKEVGQKEEAGPDGLYPYAHRDIKRESANIMIADDGKTPILMDLGSCLPARIHIRTRQEALTQQDIAAEHSSMPYRAPELFDVHTGQTLDEKVDIWSLGCTLFAIAYSYSPFEDPAQAGGSISMAVASGSYRHPRAPAAQQAYSDGFRKLIDGCLVVRKEERWGIDKVIEVTKECLDNL
ncbi:kinase-like domain-containing protein [Mrakia frigida]|uniref:putative serine/threonine protein kinase ENV7 n=1 Tax=Mrakia frigida TaxID=29902 RepID=UPI003FCC0313